VCRDQEIPLLLVYSPEYHEMQALELNRKEVFALFQKICARYQIPLWDYSDHMLCRERAYFYNSQHLNDQGASLFSRDLAQRLLHSDLVRVREQPGTSVVL